ncbi:FAD-dependent monooxygenase [Paramicrobacterium chengjingii]|uniref:FAD-dependent monooxygenase n=1 Tax=Paramicrobacterium chengjingii TaxID=2769067 RepID=A0ABX6YI35_9MICO|nr:FAD-dependent monooxygenase [Microbacterium chengjingii]QPZ38459.1 FAD-dependent monooxygenase [Microbacterium chengjingii]
MTITRVLISGASIAGPALARWLGHNGFDVTVVEKSAKLRPGGQAVDFKGRTHRQILDRMGLWGELMAHETGRTDWRIVDETDRVKAVIGGEFIGGDLEILRGDLAHILYRSSENVAEYIFDDEIVELRETIDGVDVSFAQSSSQRFDIVVGADGVHSAVRRLAFGPEERFVENLGYCYAVAGGRAPLDDLETTRGDRGIAYGYNVPGRFALLGGQKAPSLFVFSTRNTAHDRRDEESQRALLYAAFSDVGWRVPAALAASRTASDFYLDALTRTRLRSFTRGRSALVGDAGYANTLGGFGTGLALVGAYVLAGELASHRGDHEAAFAAYNRRMAKPAKAARSGSAGPFLAPRSAAGIRMRNRIFTNPLMYRSMLWATDRFATDDRIPTYNLC